MEETEVNISLVSVSEVKGATAFTRRALRHLGHTPLNVDLNVRAVPDIERSIISLVVSCSYIGVFDFIRTRVFTCAVVVNFEVPGLGAILALQGEDYVVSGKVMRTMAVGALRGVIAVRTADTPLRFRPLPIIDLTALMYRMQFASVRK